MYHRSLRSRFGSKISYHKPLRKWPFGSKIVFSLHILDIFQPIIDIHLTASRHETPSPRENILIFKPLYVVYPQPIMDVLFRCIPEISVIFGSTLPWIWFVLQYYRVHNGKNARHRGRRGVGRSSSKKKSRRLWSCFQPSVQKWFWTVFQKRKKKVQKRSFSQPFPKFRVSLSKPKET